MRGTIAGLAALLALAIVVSPTAAESGVATLTGGQHSVVATMTLSAGEVVEWSYSSGLSTKFIVNLAGTGEVFSTAAMVGHGTFTASANGQYTFTFQNTGDNMTIVSYNIQRRFDATPVIAAVGVGAAMMGGGGALLWYRKRHQAPASTPAIGEEVPPPPPPS